MNVDIKYKNLHVKEDDKYIYFIPVTDAQDCRLSIIKNDVSEPLEFKMYKSDDITYFNINNEIIETSSIKKKITSKIRRFDIFLPNMLLQSYFKIKKKSYIFNFICKDTINNLEHNIKNYDNIYNNDNIDNNDNNENDILVSNKKKHKNRNKLISNKMNNPFININTNKNFEKKTNNSEIVQFNEHYNMTIIILHYSITTNILFKIKDLNCDVILVDMLNNDDICDHLHTIIKNNNNNNNSEQYKKNIKIVRNTYNNNDIYNDVLNSIDTEIVFFIHDKQFFTKKTIINNIEKLTENNAVSIFGKNINNNYYLTNIIDTNNNFDYLSLNGLFLKKKAYKELKFDKYLNFFEDYDVTKQLSLKKYDLVVNNIEGIKYVNIFNNINKNKIYRNSKYLYDKWNIDSLYYNYDYINTLNYSKMSKNNNIEYCNVNFLLKDENMIKIEKFVNNRNVYLTMSLWGYPPYGGGENWLIDTMSWMSNTHASIMICFYDPLTSSYFDEINITEIDDLLYIQFPINYFYLIKILKLLNPICISHQGLQRKFYMELSNILNIPFISGFCFWQDIIKLTDNCNTDMLNKNLTKCDNFEYIYKNSDYLYSSSLFVNDIIQKYHNLKLDIIETISDEKHYITKLNPNRQYVTMINIHPLKGGKILENLLINLDNNIPLLLIITEKNKLDNNIKKLVDDRNHKAIEKTILFEDKISNVKDIYKKTKLLLIGSMMNLFVKLHMKE